MGKIGDLWVRLGLKKDDYTKGLNEAKREGEGFGKSVSMLGSKAKIAFAAVAAAVTGVIAAVKDLAKQNQVLGDAWNRMTSGMAASWDTFKTAVASMDFSHLISNMREASRLAKDLYNAQDALGEITTAYNIELARQADTINNLRVDLANPNLTKEQRLTAGQNLLNIYEGLEKNPTRGLERAAGASLDAIAHKLGFQMKGASAEALKATRTEVENFFVWLGSEAGEAWNQAYAEAAKDPTKLMQTTMNAQNAGLSDSYRAMLYNYQTKIGEKDRLAMEDAVVKYYQQQAMVSAETLRIRKQINTIEHEAAGKDAPTTPDGGPGTKGKTDRLQEQVQLLRQQLAEEQEIAAKDAEIARAGDEAYEAWRATADLPPVKLFDDDMLLALERGLQLAKEFGDQLNRTKDQSEDLARSITENLVSALETGLVGAFDALADVIGGVTEGGMESVARAIIEPLADMAIKAGTLIMLSGTAIEALKESLVNFFGGSSVVAGAALVAVGVAAKAGLAALGNRGSGGTAVSSYSSSGGVANSYGGVQSAELVVHVEGTVKGSDIILSGQNTLNSWNR